jgi:3-phenylpropionate/cinnamic acid dioxygenase small subunit
VLSPDEPKGDRELSAVNPGRFKTARRSPLASEGIPMNTADLQDLADRMAIQEWFTRYARYVDGKQWTEWRSLFTEDASIDYASAGGPVGDREVVANGLQAALESFPMTQHYITNIESVFEGPDRARVRAMFYNPMMFPGSTELSECGGYYHHEFVRTADGWRSERLVEENLWFKNDPR